MTDNKWKLITDRGKGKVILLRAMKESAGVEIQLRSFLTSAFGWK
jgi:hypothetical protein